MSQVEEYRADFPQPGSRWRHRPSGRYYIVVMMANIISNREDYPPTVVYRSELGIAWCRPYSRWHSSMEAMP